MKNKRIYLPLLIPLFFRLIPQCYCADLDITLLDDNLGDALGCGAFAGGLLMTVIILMFSLGVVGAASRRKPSDLIIALFSIAVFSFAVMVTWFPVYFLTFMIIIVAVIFGRRLVKL